MATGSNQRRTLIDKLDQLPPERVAEVEDFVDFLAARAQPPRPAAREPLDFPVDDLGPWPEGLSLRREELYGDDGR